MAVTDCLARSRWHAEIVVVPYCCGMGHQFVILQELNIFKLIEDCFDACSGQLANGYQVMGKIWCQPGVLEVH